MEGDVGPELFLRAVAASIDGAVTLRRSATGPVDRAADLGLRLAAELLEDGAAELVPPRSATSGQDPWRSTAGGAGTDGTTGTTRSQTRSTEGTTSSREGDL
jgi:hydroxymethylbilane synthase